MRKHYPLALILITGVLSVSYAQSHSNTTTPTEDYNYVSTINSEPPTFAVQVWAKQYHEDDCGAHYVNATKERLKSNPNWPKIMTDTNLFWACLELNRQVNGNKEKP